MIGVSSSTIITPLASDCVTPHERAFLEGCREAYGSIRASGEDIEEEELKRCYSRVRYAFSIIRSTGLVYEEKQCVYLLPCLMYYRELYVEKWAEKFKRYVKTFVEPLYGSVPIIEIDEAELRDAVERSRR